MNAQPTPAPRRPLGSEPIRVDVLCRAPETAEALNRVLRAAGLATQCRHASDTAALEEPGDAVTPPDLVIVAAEDRLLPLPAVLALRDRVSPAAVLLLLRAWNDVATESALESGAQDAISLERPAHLRRVVEREVRAARNARSLATALTFGSDVRRALDCLRDGSTDAIAEVAEGIVIAANPAWLELTGYGELGSIDGLPIMDCFTEASRPALRGALLAATQGRWPSEPLRLQVHRGDGGVRPVDVALSVGATTDGERVITLRSIAQPSAIAPPAATNGARMEALQAELAVARRADLATGLPQRTAFLEDCNGRCAVAPSGGVRYVAVLRTVSTDPATVDELSAADARMGSLADTVRCHLTPSDCAGRLADRHLAVLLERGTAADVGRWADQVRAGAGPRAERLSIALAALNDGTAQDGLRRAWVALETAGADGVVRVDASREASDEGDRPWIQRIKTALIDNRFRLTRQPIAPLRGGSVQNHDLLVRLVDEAGRDVLPSEFLEVAGRHNLLCAIDRWVLSAAVALAAAEPGHGLFVRISAHSLVDPGLPAWLSGVLTAATVAPQHLILQVPAVDLERHPDAAVALRRALQAVGVRFAIEHLGAGAHRVDLIRRLQPDLVKIDGHLMQGLALHPAQQEAVRDLVVAATALGVGTVAERVEDANTMAVLYALGVEAIQGRFVERCEAVTLG